ncbi:hypothetical protein SNEBB_003023 [Seison nebaliae]|nr:hypothetical protein SNEBB_003023 [Seison nebaliae]
MFKRKTSDNWSLTTTVSLILNRRIQNILKTCYLRVHFKNTREAAHAIKKMPLVRAQRYLKHVMDKVEIVPFKRFNGGVGRKAQCKNWNCNQGRWPAKSCKVLLELLKIAESNADYQGIEQDKLVIDHIQVNQAPNMRRRTYRAHGRINPFISHPCHIEMILGENDTIVSSKPQQDMPIKKKKESRKKIKRQMMMGK